MADEIGDDSKAIVARYLRDGKVCLMLVWDAAGAFNYFNPKMRTDQLTELLRDALSQFTDAEPVKGKPH